jgi:hypothetical protein
MHDMGVEQYESLERPVAAVLSELATRLKEVQP